MLTNHTNLFVQFFGWYEDPKFLYIAMEYVELGDLSKYIKDPSTHLDPREVTRQVLKGLVVLHDMRICHRDLKPKNILVSCLDPIWVKIADFGISKREKDTSLNTAIGTEGYTAPEVNLLRGSGKYTNAVDLWSLGCLVHELLTSEVPFLGIPLVETSFSTDDFSGIVSNRPAQFYQSSQPPRRIDMILLYEYCRGNREFPVEILQRFHASERCIDFVKKLLAANPNLRGTAADALKSPWLHT